MDEFIIDEFQVNEGNWILTNDGIYHKYKENCYVLNDRITWKEGTGIDSPWMWPLHFNRKNILSLGDINDLLTCCAIKRYLLGNGQDNESDKVTWEKILEEREFQDLDFPFIECDT